MPASAPFLVKLIEIDGNTSFDQQTLHALVAPEEGSTLTLPQLGPHRGADHRLLPWPRLSAGARDHSSTDHRGRYRSHPNRRGALWPDRARRYTRGRLNAAGDTDSLANRQVDRRPAPQSRAAAAGRYPGRRGHGDIDRELVGTSDLEVNTTATPAVAGNVALDNDGNYIREGHGWRNGEPGQSCAPRRCAEPHGPDLWRHELWQRELRVAAEWAGHACGRGILGAAFRARRSSRRPRRPRQSNRKRLAKHPLVRTPGVNLYAQLQYDHRQLDDAIGAGALHTDRHLDNGTASVSGDLRDTLLSGAVNSWIGLDLGRVGFDDVGARRPMPPRDTQAGSRSGIPAFATATTRRARFPVSEFGARRATQRSRPE